MGLTIGKGLSSFFDPDSTRELCDSESSSRFQSADGIGQLLASGRPCEDVDNFTKLDAEISVKRSLPFKPRLSTSGHNSSLSQSHCAEYDVGRMVLATAVGGDCITIQSPPTENMLQTDCMEYSALKHVHVPTSVSTPVCDTDSVSSAEIDSSDDRDEVCLPDADYVTTSPSKKTEASAHCSSDIQMKNTDCSCDKFDSHCEAAGTVETTSYIQLLVNNYDVLRRTNGENDGSVANKPTGKMGTVFSGLRTTGIQASKSDSLSKMCTDSVVTDTVNCEIKRLVTKNSPGIISIAETATSLDVCNSCILDESCSDAVFKCDVNYENDGLVAETTASGTEAVETHTFICVESHDDLVKTHTSTLSVSATNCENDLTAVEKSSSTTEHLCPVDEPAVGPFSCLSNSDVDEVKRTVDDGGEQTVVGSAARNSPSVCSDTSTDAGNSTLHKSTDWIWNGEMAVSSP